MIAELSYGNHCIITRKCYFDMQARMLYAFSDKPMIQVTLKQVLINQTIIVIVIPKPRPNFWSTALLVTPLVLGWSLAEVT